MNIDVITELKYLIPSYYDLIVPSVVINELSTLKKKSKGKDKLSAAIAYKIANNKPFKVVYINKQGHVDNLLLNYCTSWDVLCTNDKILRKRARGRGITVIYLRQHKFLEVDGHIKHENFDDN